MGGIWARPTAGGQQGKGRAGSLGLGFLQLLSAGCSPRASGFPLGRGAGVELAELAGARGGRPVRDAAVRMSFSAIFVSFVGEKMSSNNGWFQKSSQVPSFAQMLKKNLPVQPPAQTVTTPAAQSSESDSLSRMASKVTPVTGTTSFPLQPCLSFLRPGWPVSSVEPPVKCFLDNGLVPAARRLLELESDSRLCRELVEIPPSPQSFLTLWRCSRFKSCLAISR